MDESPIRVIQSEHEGHKLETRVYAREIYESYCVDPGCEFNGKRSAQGICHTRLEGVDHEYMKRVQSHVDEWLADMHKEREPGKDEEYIKYLEGQLYCHLMNDRFSLDHLVSLRMKIARLELKLGEYKETT